MSLKSDNPDDVMNRLEMRVKKLEKIASGKSKKAVLWLVNQETKEEAMKKAGVTKDDDFFLTSVVFVSPKERFDGCQKKQA